MRLSFRFKEVDVGGFGIIRRPIIPVTLSSMAGMSMDVEAIIDSGSDGAIITKDMADALQVVLGKKTEEIGLGGEKMRVVLGHVRLAVTDGRETVRLMDVPVNVPIEGGAELEEMIIGREPFFRDFNVTFQQNSNSIILERARRA